jgi:hypothetical protein
VLKAPTIPSWPIPLIQEPGIFHWGISSITSSSNALDLTMFR